MRRFWGALVGSLLVAAVVWAATSRPANERYTFRNGITVQQGDSGSAGAALTTVTNSVNILEVAPVGVRATFCGENAENAAIYFGPVPLTSPFPALADSTCDALDNATEGTADAPVSVSGTLRPMAMFCITDATLGSGETIVNTLRAATASVQAGGADFACTIVESATTCEVHTNGDTVIAANTAMAVRSTETSNNADGDETLCSVYFLLE